MTTTEATSRRRFAVVLGLTLTVGFVSGFLTGMPGMAPLVAVPVAVLCAFGGHSLWLTTFGVLEPAELTWWRNVLVPIAAVVGVAFVLAVVKRRRWKPSEPVAQRDLGKDFL